MKRREITPTPVPTCAAEEASRLRSKRHLRGATVDIAGAATLSAKRVCGLSLLASAFKEIISINSQNSAQFEHVFYPLHCFHFLVINFGYTIFFSNISNQLNLIFEYVSISMT